ncbi:E3 ubiquitin-protein ligase RNF130-like [Elgaria multicarinata webbii]|uniref:E3 ubiquitin-protein ligase RNF130-like n=1 Tax=Elgaria multicarinata webbii TaxID=159646 RepID=UPI002FCCF172
MILKWILPYWNYLLPVPILVQFYPYAFLDTADDANRGYVLPDVKMTVLNPDGSVRDSISFDPGRYGLQSPRVAVKGLLVAPLPVNEDPFGCNPQTKFHVPPNTKQWIALLKRGKCTFKQKILQAASYNASAVVIYNISGEGPVTMTHNGTGDTVAVMIKESKIKMILYYLANNMTVLTTIAVGSQ